MSNLRNYTSEVPASTSIMRIEKRLIDMGATSIVKQYDGNKRTEGITFCFTLKNQTVAFQMPANIDKVFAVLWKTVRNPQRVKPENYWQQAERTAWKNVADWVDIQCTLITMEQVEFMEVFLPYALAPGGKTIYQIFNDNPQKLLS